MEWNYSKNTEKISIENTYDHINNINENFILTEDKVKKKFYYEDKIYYLLEYEKNKIYLKVFINDMLTEVESKEYKTNYDIDCSIFCNFNEKLSFSVSGGYNLTQFDINMGYTVRVLPFKICKMWPFENGILLLSSEPFMKYSYFYLTSSLNDLYIIRNTNEIRIIIDEVGFNHILMIDDIFCSFHNIVINENTSENILNIDYENKINVSHNSAFTTPKNSSNVLSNTRRFSDASFYTSGNFEHFTKDKTCATNASILSIILTEKAQNSINISDRFASIFENSLKIQSPELKDNLQQRSITLVKDTRLSQFNLTNSFQFNSLKSFLYNDFCDAKYLLIFYTHTQTCFIISLTSSPLNSAQFEDISDAVYINELKVVALIRSSQDILIISGLNLIIRLHVSQSIQKIIYSRHRILIAQGNTEMFVIRIPTLTSQPILVYNFFQFLLKEESNENAKKLYDCWVITALQKYNSTLSDVSIFALTIWLYIEILFDNLNIEDVNFRRSRNIKENRKTCRVIDYSSILTKLSSSHYFCYNTLLKYYWYLQIKSAKDKTKIYTLQQILDQIYDRILCSNINITPSLFVTNSVYGQIIIRMLNCHYIDQKQLCFLYQLFGVDSEGKSIGTISVENYEENQYNLLLKLIHWDSIMGNLQSELNKTSNQTSMNSSLFPIIKSNSLNSKRLLNTKKKLDWSNQSVFYSNSEDVFQASNDSFNEEENGGESRNNIVNRQKYNYSCLLNKIYSTPIGRGCLNLCVGCFSVDGNSLKIKNSNINYEGKLLVKDDNNYFFTLIVPLESKDINQPILAWPKFHNGVSLALTNINPKHLEYSSLDDDTNFTTFSNNIESWIQYAIDNLCSEEIGGFIFGCGLIKQLYNIPIIAPGFLLNFLLKNKSIAVSGLLLGLASSHIGYIHNRTSLLSRRLQRIFFIHTGLSKMIADNQSSKSQDASKKDSFDYESVDITMNVHTQTAAIVCLGLIGLNSSDTLILNMLKKFFDSMLFTSSHFQKLSSGVQGFVPPINTVYYYKALSLATALSIGLIVNHENCDKGIFTWDKYYGNLIDLLSTSDNRISNFVESAYLMIALSYLKSNNYDAAKLLDISTNTMVRKSTKPYLLCVSTWLRGLIMDSLVQPSLESIFGNLPPWVKGGLSAKKALEKNPSSDFENLVNSWSMLTGWCYAIAFKYSSTFDVSASAIFEKFIKKLTTIIDYIEDSFVQIKPYFLSNLKDCLARLALGWSLIYAGSCYSKIKLAIKDLSRKYSPKLKNIEKEMVHNVSFFLSPVSGNHGFGFHMALNMALGLLCLGNGMITLNTTSIESISTLVCSLYPVFPNIPSDNSSMFQPLRHLYVLSCTKARHFIFKLENTKNLPPEYLNVVFHIECEEEEYEIPYKLEPPYVTIIPQLKNVKSIKITSGIYKTVHLSADKLNQLNEPFKLSNIGTSYEITLVQESVGDENELNIIPADLDSSILSSNHSLIGDNNVLSKFPRNPIYIASSLSSSSSNNNTNNDINPQGFDWIRDTYINASLATNKHQLDLMLEIWQCFMDSINCLDSFSPILLASITDYLYLGKNGDQKGSVSTPPQLKGFVTCLFISYQTYCKLNES